MIKNIPLTPAEEKEQFSLIELLNQLNNLGYPIQEDSVFYYYSPLEGLYINCGKPCRPLTNTFTLADVENNKISIKVKNSTNGIKAGFSSPTSECALNNCGAENPFENFQLNSQIGDGCFAPKESTPAMFCETNFCCETQVNNCIFNNNNNNQKVFPMNDNKNNQIITENQNAQVIINSILNTELELQNKSKTRTIGYIIEKVAAWRELYMNPSDPKTRLQAAKIVGISKRTLEDYQSLLKIARKNSFDFQKHKSDNVGVLRLFVKKIKEKMQKKAKAKDNADNDFNILDILPESKQEAVTNVINDICNKKSLEANFDMSIINSNFSEDCITRKFITNNERSCLDDVVSEII